MKPSTILIGLGTITALFIIYKKFIAKDEEKSNFTACRAGTCPYTRTDGSTFCTSAACTKSTSGKTGV